MGDVMPEQYESPLLTKRGSTRIPKKVVSRVVGLACLEVEGVFVGGKDARDETRGVSVEVGRVEAAVDLDLALAYEVDLIRTTERLRGLIRDRVWNLIGLRVTDLNVTVKEIVFPDKDATEHPANDGDENAATEDEPPARTEAQSEPDTEVSEERDDSSRGQEEVRVEGEPLERGEGAELESGEEEIRKYLLEREAVRDGEASDEASSEKNGGRRRDGA